MCTTRDCRVNALLFIFILCAPMAYGQGSFPGEKEGGRGLVPTTHDTDREVHVVTTAPPLNIPNHHPLLKEYLLPEALLTKDFRGQKHFFEDDGGSEQDSTKPSSSSRFIKEPSTHRAPPEARDFSDIAYSLAGRPATSPTVSVAPSSPALPGVAAHAALLNNGGRTTSRLGEGWTTNSLTTPVLSSAPHPSSDGAARPASSQQPVTVTTSLTPSALTTSAAKVVTAAREPNAGPHREVTPVTSSSTGDVDYETISSTIITTTVITTAQTPAPCSTNFTAPEGHIEVPAQPGAWSYPGVDCTYAISVYMGYGVEIQVLNVSLLEGEMVTLEDLGCREPLVLANESILMKGLVVRSQSNHIAIRFRSEQRPQPGSFLLRYQAFVLSCPFPRRPAYGDVSVTSLHAAGEAYFYCLNGYQLQGPSTLTCRNATTPYWSGREPRCLAACGGMIKPATVGRIVSPGFPGNYSNNLTCHWVLEAPLGHRLHIHFEKVALAEDDDRLLIKNGNNIDSPPLYDSYEVEYLPNEGIVSSSHHLFVELITDASGTSTGTAIRYEAFAQGRCYEPFVKYGNFTSSDANYTVGALVEFSCDPGYTLEQGSVLIECMDPSNPQWNETEPACRAVCSGEITDSAGVVLSPNWPEAYDKGQDCIWGIHVEEDKRIMLDIQVLHVGKNDVLTFYDGDDLTAKVLGQYAGTRPRFKLYTSMADVIIQFQSDPATNVFGYHNGFVIHFFEVPRNDTCPELPEITNGWKSTSHPELIHGTVVTYQCYPGFELQGTEILMCQWDLTWSGDLPSCEKVRLCADPGNVEHSRRITSAPRLTVGSTVQYVCNKGYMLSGNSLLTCHNHDPAGPRWTKTPPKCVPETYNTCKNPGTPPFSIQSQEKPFYQAGETLRFTCLTGYELQGEPALCCVPGRPSRWSHAPPVCQASAVEYSKRRLDVAGADFSIEGISIAVAVFIPVAIILALIFGIYLYFSKVQGKSFLQPMSSSVPYNHITPDFASGVRTYDNGPRLVISDY
ncbi:LOW QUALITY PROTEIN: seizure protein 6 homolog [Brienomyrus brachyistius]|uniref:LOW QUALITY PROTEIN: seizure protein 6 homolog n=1 Tax=Brienomyrus brachyistius TaxID=42636 RepID=UPI0020B45E40|nr:LOW QUALITY PROTEIN: seizure protein 6 homolog [Brienomyrus brachyistius]